MISASPTGPATLSSVPAPLMPIATSAWYTPQTVPNRPTNGAVAPTVASTARPFSSRVVSSSSTFLIVRVTKSPDAARLLELGRAVAGVVRLRLHRVRGQVRERVVRAVGGDLAGDRVERGRVPEEVQEGVAAAACAPAA